MAETALTLDDLDRMIAKAPDAAAIYVSTADWWALFHQPGPIDHMGVLPDGRIVYRNLPVWIRTPGATEVIDAATADAHGIVGKEGSWR